MIKIAAKITGFSVSTPHDPPASAVPNAFTNDQDRRLTIDHVPTTPLESIQSDKRPVDHRGFDGRTYTIDSPMAGRFGVLINTYALHGKTTPFEVWVLGEGPRGLNALAKSLSLDMRSSDRGWLKLKLESLMKTAGEGFDMTLPDGTLAHMPSEVAAFATLIHWRCNELGTFDDLSDTRVVDALMSRKEPKTTTDGTLSWTVDISNPVKEDDFVLFLKEAILPDGQRRPFSVWMSGVYPKSLDGLCKSLSLDLRVSPIAWGIRKIRQLLDCVEPGGDFMAPIPGHDDKRKMYPSSVAYVADLLLHRLKMLNLTGETIGQGVVSFVQEKARREQEAHEHKGALCSSCHTYAVRKIDGCDTCVNCGQSKCAG